MKNPNAPAVKRYEAWKAQKAPIFWCTYGSFFQNPLLHARRMLQHLEFDYSDGKIQQAIDATQDNKAATKFNKGTPGRGVTAFTSGEQQRVIDLIDSYRGFDAREAGMLT
jgi:hypothetical protein